jgi:uncharacterized protein YhbP (UPF0306 family)
LADRIAAFLDAHHVMSLATLGPDGAHAANVFYVREQFSLFWVSDPTTRHSVHIATHAGIAATIAPDFQDFPQIKGLQLVGTARCLTEAHDDQHGRQLLQQRYPFLGNAATAPPALREAYDRARVYRFDPSKIVMIDNSRGFGSKETLEIAPGAAG